MFAFLRMLVVIHDVSFWVGSTTFTIHKFWDRGQGWTVEGWSKDHRFFMLFPSFNEAKAEAKANGFIIIPEDFLIVLVGFVCVVLLLLFLFLVFMYFGHMW